MENKRINVVWCDDKFNSVCNEDVRQRFEDEGLDVIKGVTTARELEKYLEAEKDIVDAVIVDFNLGEYEEVPEEKSARGFAFIRDSLIKKYSSKIPFYLYTTWTDEEVKEKLAQYDIKNFEKDYFFNPDNSEKKRIFRINEREYLISVICQDVNEMNTEAFKIRQQFASAFAVIKTFNLSAKLFIDILKLDESVDDKDELCTYANSIRKEIESLSSELQKKFVLPIGELNKLPKILHGDDDYCKYDDHMPNSLFYAFEFLLKYTQDGSHNKNCLTIDFHNYLKEKNDVYIVKSLAIIALDIIMWMGELGEIYNGKELYGPFPAVVNEVKAVKGIKGEHHGGMVFESKKKFFLPQPQHNEKKKLNVGDRVHVKSWETTSPSYGDYYVNDWEYCDSNGSVKNEPLIS